MDPATRPARLIEEAITRLGTYAGHEDMAQAEAAALDRLDHAVGELTRLIAPHHGWDLVELLRLRNSYLPESGVPASEHDGSAAVIELVALLVAARDASAAPSSCTGARIPAGFDVEPVQKAALDCFHAASLLLLFRNAAQAHSLSFISMTSVLREVMLRNSIYPHMLRDTLQELFGGTLMEKDCRDVLGFTAADAVAVLEACNTVRNEAWQRRFDVLRGVFSAAMTLEEEGSLGTDPDTAAQDRDRSRDAARRAWEHVWARPAESAAFTCAEIAGHCGLRPEVVQAVVSAFTLPARPRAAREVALEFFTGRSTLRVTPLLQDDRGRALLVHDALLLPAVRELIEQRLKDAGRWDAYSKHRGAYVERTAIDLLLRHLPGAVAHIGFEYRVPDPSDPSPRSGPAGYTKTVEADGLIVVDDVAIVVETKAGALTPLARTGESRRLRSNLGRIVTEAAEQAHRLRERIEVDHGLRLRDGTWLDLAHVQEVHTVAVSLEDLSGISTTTADLAAAGLLPGTAYPWTVSLHDLRVICELVDRPAELLLYLQRRTAPETTMKFRAVDELDLFLHFFRKGLYVEPDPEIVRQELPQFGQATIAAQRRRSDEAVHVLSSETDRLDTWYDHRLGHSSVPADKPTMNGDPALLALVDAVAATRAPGWLATGATLLAGSAKTQRQFGRVAEQLARRSRKDRAPHTMAIISGATRQDSYLLIWMSHLDGQGQADPRRFLRDYLEAKKHQMRMTRAAGFLVDARTAVLTDVLFDNRVPGADPGLDALVERLALRPPARTPRSLPPPSAQRGR
ncbi:hypothetical protein [Kitasatospora sp. NPDC056273]|uniref:hypothetical protein n=1 Tax=Kitasatospora sp. NPDC056273 TaxID=3345769 RepID=UPI0035E0682C